MRTTVGLVVLAAASVLLSACGGGYVAQTPRYPTRMDQLPPASPQYPTTQTPAPSDQPYYGGSESVLPPAQSSSVEASELPPLPGQSLPPAPPAPSASSGSGGGSGAPLRPGRAYIVQQGDTLSGIARRFGTPVRTLSNLNGLGESGAIQIGARIILPEGARDNGSDPYATGPSPMQDTVPPVAAAPSTPAYVPPPPPPPSSSTPYSTGSSSATGGFPDGAELVRRAGNRFQWPVRGELLTRFGTMGSGLRSDGINIGAPSGTEVRASTGGQVAYAGDSLPGLGTTVVIVHGDGWVTAYSHLGSTNVRMEQRVTQGQVIGTTGTTGGVTQPQVHFEIRYTPSTADRPRPVDPLPLLGN